MDPDWLNRKRIEFEELIDRARSGCRDSLGQLLDSLRRVLLRRARSEIPPYLDPKAAPSDLVQDTFLEAQSDFPQFQGKTREEFLAWIVSILRNNIRNLGRRYAPGTKREVNKEVQLNDESLLRHVQARLHAIVPTPPDEALKREQRELFDRQVAKLPETCRVVFHLHITQDQSHAEIAKYLQTSEHAIRRVWRRAKRLLVDRLNGDRLKLD